YKSLIMAETLIAEGEYDPARILRSIREFIEKNTSGEIDYIEILSYPDLKQLSCLEEKIIIAMAVKFKKARLIDNAIISVKKES
ncbi:pantoate--beta-alanine ligase, partial [Shouchella clausii]